MPKKNQQHVAMRMWKSTYERHRKQCKELIKRLGRHVTMTEYFDRLSRGVKIADLEV